MPCDRIMGELRMDEATECFLTAVLRQAIQPDGLTRAFFEKMRDNHATVHASPAEGEDPIKSREISRLAAAVVGDRRDPAAEHVTLPAV